MPLTAKIDPDVVVVPGTATGTQQDGHISSARDKHPLDPLTADEIISVSFTVRHYLASETPVKAIKFITSYLLPPPKKVVLAHLGIPISPGGKPESPTEIVRKAEVDFIDVVNGDAYNAKVSLQGTKWVVDALEKLPEGTQPQISPEELAACEATVRNDPRVQELARDIGISVEQIHADGWSIGYDDRFPTTTRLQAAILFARLSEHENLYAHPLDFVPVIDVNLNKVIHIDFAGTYSALEGLDPVISTGTTVPPPLSDDGLAAAHRERIPPPLKRFDFLPDLLAKDKDHKPRDDIKPLHIVQPEGVSFKMNGNELEWQKWKMHVAFSHREGIAISTLTYNDNGEIRPIFYRLSLAEMIVPYGAPEHPHPRKFAFDAGEYGMATMANDLSLGCDCLGTIHYLPGAYVGNDGSAVTIKNAICIHEEDAGVLWKHTDYRPGGRGQTVRRRRLVISMVCTLANYEYIWNYHFYQDGTIELEIRLTGILQTYVAKDGEPNPFGTTVAPKVNAHYHQHIFSIRVDPMVDGLQNSVVETDIEALSAPTGSAENYAGNGFTVKEKVLRVENEGGRTYDFEKDRRWRIVNPGRRHYSSGKDVGYTIGMKGGATRMLAKSNGWAGRRAAFAGKALWVVKDEEGAEGSRMWPAGKYVPQTREEPSNSLGKWAQGEGNIENEDILVYVTVGTTHIPRPEDWPVMPAELLSVTFKPHSFFDANPSMDVPGIKDTHSVAAFDDGGNSAGDCSCSN
ncbi:hypothetical protein PLICRDRAFT_171908 [Plicaturopsis crispa FD-325 SS-3]|nr:hypothetical protein PLICRDRAFT_171908 [Plicaturopsis crispa FD-325 SS-3]